MNNSPTKSEWLAGVSRAGTALPLLAALLGCSGGSLPDRADPEQAKQALQTALETWKKGESVETLTQRRPAILFNDPKAASGMRLASFEIEGAHDFFGQSVRFSVKATVELKDARKERKFTYLIDTTPVVVIVPD